MDDQKVLELFKTHSDITDPGYGRWAYEEWERLNQDLFDGELKPVAIQWGYTPGGDPANYDYHREVMIFPKKRWLRPIDKKSPEAADDKFDYWFIRDKQAFSDFLLHEMIHQSIHQSGDYTVTVDEQITPLFKLHEKLRKENEGEYEEFPYLKTVNHYTVNHSHRSSAWLKMVDKINDRLKLTNKAAQPYQYSDKRDPMKSFEIERFPFFFREYFQEKFKKYAIIKEKINKEGEKRIVKVIDNFYPE